MGGIDYTHSLSRPFSLLHLPACKLKCARNHRKIHCFHYFSLAVTVTDLNAFANLYLSFTFLYMNRYWDVLLTLQESRRCTTSDICLKSSMLEHQNTLLHDLLALSCTLNGHSLNRTYKLPFEIMHLLLSLK